MEIKLQCTTPLTLEVGIAYGEISFVLGEIVLCDFRDTGVRFFKNNYWTQPYYVSDVEKYFKVYGQD